MAGKSKRTSQRGLKPKLRFPEFANNGHWTTEPLQESAEVITEKAGERKCIYLSVTSGVGLVSQEEKFGRTIAGKSYKNYYLIRRNDFAYNKSSTKDFPQGYIAMYSGHKLASVPNSIFTCFRVDANTLVPEYLDYLFHGNHHGRWLQKYITVGARAHGSLSVNDADLMSMPVPRPSGETSLAEQQKIAECLSSLDELIGAESRKLEALQAHKKGLMQQLFPREGETLPRLRFPEFKHEPEWEEKPLAKVAENLDSQRVPITEADREQGDVPYYGASGVVDYVKGHIFDEELLCVSEDGANLVSRTYPIAFSISRKTWVNNHAHVLRFPARFTQVLVKAYLNATDLGDFITGMAQPKLNRGNLDIIPIPLPQETEQREIAKCLTSLDHTIEAQSKKLEVLCDHKQGLMQQLFPSTEEEK